MLDMEKVAREIVEFTHKKAVKEKKQEMKDGDKIVKALFKQLNKLLLIEETLTIAIGDNKLEQTTLDLIARFDTATNRIADLVKALIEKANNAGSVTAAEVNAALTPVVAKLEGIGKDPENPV